MVRLRLYSIPDCHLCEVAESLIQESCTEVNLQKVNIENDRELLRDYEIRIPVLKRMDTGAELSWPFDESGLADFLKLTS